MPDRKTVSMETAGSLAPELEGAPHSAGHSPRHTSPRKEKPQAKGGMRHPR